MLDKAMLPDPREAVLLLAHVMDRDEVIIKARLDDKVSAKQAKVFLQLAERRARHEPIAYLLRTQPFCGVNIMVNENVLIPRSETETLVEIVKADIRREVAGNKKNIIIDIGTGSGCIACTLKKNFPKAKVLASDYSPAALSVVKYNDKVLHTNLKIIHSDLLGIEIVQELNRIFSNRKSVAVYVVANLPYLPHSDADTMQKDVYSYEPKDALFADDDGMLLIKKCIQQFKVFISHYSARDINWKLYFEIDSRQANKLWGFAKQVFNDTNSEIKKDLCGRDRFLLIG